MFIVTSHLGRTHAVAASEDHHFGLIVVETALGAFFDERGELDALAEGGGCFHSARQTLDESVVTLDDRLL
jgi:hypothetical protein